MKYYLLLLAIIVASSFCTDQTQQTPVPEEELPIHLHVSFAANNTMQGTEQVATAQQEQEATQFAKKKKKKNKEEEDTVFKQIGRLFLFVIISHLPPIPPLPF